VRSIVLGARSCLVAILCFGLLNLPTMAASAKPLGMVVLAENARLDNARAVKGADLYPGDALVTDVGGSLRIRVGASQVYLLSSTSAMLAQVENKVRAKVERGTLGFSTAASDRLEVETPLGVVRGTDGQHVFGQVVVLSAKEMRVTSYEGTLFVETNGLVKTIGQGQTYDATLVANSDPGAPQGPNGAGRSGINWTRVAWTAGFVGGAATLGGVFWDEFTESCITPTSCPDK
jgi:hypothetical protein